MSPFVVGQEYPFDAISAAFGGDNASYLPQAGGRIVCGRFRADMNPNVPHEVLVGDPPMVQRRAEMLVGQGGAIPVFVKQATNRWLYHGPMQVVGFDRSVDIVRSKAAAAGRKDVVGMLSFRDAR